MSKKFNNFLTANKTAVRKVCYAWIALALLACASFSAYFMYFADYSGVRLTLDIGITPAQYMAMLGVNVTGILTVYMILPVLAILSKLKKLSA